MLSVYFQSDYTKVKTSMLTTKHFRDDLRMSVETPGLKFNQ